MSAQQSSSAARPPADHGVSNGGPDFSSDDHHRPMENGPMENGPMENGPTESAAGAPETPLATAELANLLANGRWPATEHGPNSDATELNAYDGHVALALDTGVLPDIDSTLDLLTSSHHLFDVPALDVSSSPDDTSSA
jgi:hypothetical protein